MQRRSRFLTILVCFFASLALADATFAQFAGVNWKRWDWSILNPGDEASSTVARIFSPNDSLEQCSIGLFAVETASATAEDFAPSVARGLGKCQIGSFASQFSRGTRWFHIQFLGISKELLTTWEFWLCELKSQGELICCARAALLARESQRETREYWNYYEDRSRWLGSARLASYRTNRIWNADDWEKLNRQNQKAELALTLLSSFPSKQISSVGTKASRLLDWSTTQLLELNEQLVSKTIWWNLSRKTLSQVFRFASDVFGQLEKRPALKGGALGKQSIAYVGLFAAATATETQQMLMYVESIITASLKGSVEVLALVPIEAIGYVLAD